MDKIDKIDSDHLNGHSIALIIDSIINLLIETKLLNSNFFNEDSKRDFIEECVLKHLSKEYDCCPNKFDPTERFKIIKNAIDILQEYNKYSVVNKAKFIL